MTKQHIQGYGSALEIYYSSVDKNSIKSKDDLYKVYLENLIDHNSNSDCYFSTVEYQNNNFDEITVNQNLIKSTRNIISKPTSETIVIATYVISKKGYLEFDIDDEIEVDVTYSTFMDTAWIEDISQDGEIIETEITDFGRPNEEGVSLFFLDSKSDLKELYNGAWYSISDKDDVDEDIEETIRESTDEWFDDFLNNH